MRAFFFKISLVSFGLGVAIMSNPTMKLFPRYKPDIDTAMGIGIGFMLFGALVLGGLLGDIKHD